MAASFRVTDSFS